MIEQNEIISSPPANEILPDIAPVQEIQVRELKSTYFLRLSHVGFICFWQDVTHSWLRLEDDDDSSVDLLTSSSPSVEAEDLNAGKIAMGDIFTSHKQVYPFYDDSLSSLFSSFLRYCF